MAKKVLVICGTGVATSTVIVQKIREFAQSKDLEANISQGKVSDLVSGGTNADFIVATTQVPDSVNIPVIPGLPFLTGIGLEGTFEKIEELLRA